MGALCSLNDSLHFLTIVLLDFIFSFPWNGHTTTVKKLSLRATSHTRQEPWPGGHEFMRAQEIVAKGHPNTPPNHEVWSWTLKYIGNSYVTGPSTKCYFRECLFMWVLTHDTIEYINGCECSESHSLLVWCQAYLQEAVIENSPSDRETWSIWCHVGIHVNFTCIHILHWSPQA